MSERFSLKDQLFHAAKVTALAAELQAVYPDFAAEAFVAEVLKAFPELELKARIRWICTCLQRHLPADFRAATQILLAALPPACDPNLSDGDFGDFIYAPYAEFVAQGGCCADHLDFSLQALKAITTRFSAEGPIRNFLNAFPEQTLATLLSWTQDSHYHVRRLASEGTRPRLPWCQNISLPPEQALPILDALHADPTRFVTRSVANHLNDLSKTQPQRVLQTLQTWQVQQRQQPQELAYITRHALRTLIKQGHPGALQCLGYSPEPEIQVRHFTLAADVVELGQALSFAFDIEALAPVKLVVDYRLYFLNKQGQLSPKVFKIKHLNLQAQQRVRIQKQHPLRLMTTKALYPGQHAVELQINGQSFGRQVFELQV